MTVVVPFSAEIRRQIILDAAKQLVLSEAFGPPVAVINAALLPLGIDVLRNPVHMMWLSVLGDSFRYGLEPSRNALERLGAA